MNLQPKKNDVFNQMKDVYVEDMHGTTVNLFGIFDGWLTGNSHHDNPKMAKFVALEYLQEDIEIKLRKGVGFVYSDCIYLYCNAALLGIIDLGVVKFEALIEKQKLLNLYSEFQTNDSQPLINYLVEFYKKISYQ
jgi:hypothetical protein